VDPRKGQDQVLDALPGNMSPLLTPRNSEPPLRARIEVRRVPRKMERSDQDLRVGSVRECNAGDTNDRALDAKSKHINQISNQAT